MDVEETIIKSEPIFIETGLLNYENEDISVCSLDKMKCEDLEYNNIKSNKSEIEIQNASGIFIEKTDLTEYSGHKAISSLIKCDSDNMPLLNSIQDNLISICNSCSLGYKNEKEYKEHKLSCPFGSYKKEFNKTDNSIKIVFRPLSCNVCPAKFYERAHLARHKFVHKTNIDYSFPCKTCNAKFIDIKNLRDHEMIHKEVPREYYCKICLQTRTNETTLKVHLRKHNEFLSISCSVCFEKFTSQKLMLRHMTAHQKSKFSCQECLAKFNNKDELKRHLLIHSGISALASKNLASGRLRSFVKKKKFLNV